MVDTPDKSEPSESTFCQLKQILPFSNKHCSSSIFMNTKQNNVSTEIKSIFPQVKPNSDCSIIHKPFLFSLDNCSRSTDNTPKSDYNVNLEKLKLSPSCRISSAKITRVNSFSKTASKKCKTQLCLKFRHLPYPENVKDMPLTSHSFEYNLAKEHLDSIWPVQKVQPNAAQISINRYDNVPSKSLLDNLPSSLESSKHTHNRLFTPTVDFSREKLLFDTNHLCLNLLDSSDSLSSSNSSLTYISSDQSSDFYLVDKYVSKCEKSLKS